MVERLFIALFICILAGTCAANKTALPSEHCEKEPDPGICRGMLKKWFYNATSFRCERFYYGGCNGNDNRFDTFAECRKKCRDPVLGVCALPERKQICRAGFRGYRFDPLKQRCVSYIYCEHNENHFPTEDACQHRCGKFAQDPCLLPKHSGRNCSRSSRMENFWFNSETKACEPFDYEGCGGNGNNFLYESECWKTCGNYVTNKCSYPIHRGQHCPNGSEQVVYGFNTKNKRCERFVYSGCGGYPNRFDSASECWSTCGLNSGSKCMEPGPKYNRGLVKKYYYDLKSDSCKTSRYSPSSRKKNRFDNLHDCEATCKGIIFIGDPKAAKGRPEECGYGYDISHNCKPGGWGFRYTPSKERCEKHYFKCEAKKGVFYTMEECKRKCAVVSKDPCTMRKYAGISCPLFEKPREVFWFNKDAQRCELFYFSGCLANGNNFEDAKECWDECRDHVTDPCNFPISSGDFCAHDTKYTTRQTVFGYNGATKKCEQYIYYGCGGYGNRFNTSKECWKACGAKSGSKCSLPVSGASGAYTRYYYDIETNTCRYRGYLTSGIDGVNRFYSREDCENECKANYTFISRHV